MNFQSDFFFNLLQSNSNYWQRTLISNGSLIILMYHGVRVIDLIDRIIRFRIYRTTTHIFLYFRFLLSSLFFFVLSSSFFFVFVLPFPLETAIYMYISELIDYKYFIRLVQHRVVLYRYRGQFDLIRRCANYFWWREIKSYWYQVPIEIGNKIENENRDGGGGREEKTASRS